MLLSTVDRRMVGIGDRWTRSGLEEGTGSVQQGLLWTGLHAFLGGGECSGQQLPLPLPLEQAHSPLSDARADSEFEFFWTLDIGDLGRVQCVM